MEKMKPNRMERNTYFMIMCTFLICVAMLLLRKYWAAHSEMQQSSQSKPPIRTIKIKVIAACSPNKQYASCKWHCIKCAQCPLTRCILFHRINWTKTRPNCIRNSKVTNNIFDANLCEDRDTDAIMLLMQYNFNKMFCQHNTMRTTDFYEQNEKLKRWQRNCPDEP